MLGFFLCYSFKFRINSFERTCIQILEDRKIFCLLNQNLYLNKKEESKNYLIRNFFSPANINNLYKLNMYNLSLQIYILFFFSIGEITYSFNVIKGAIWVNTKVRYLYLIHVAMILLERVLHKECDNKVTIHKKSSYYGIDESSL